MINSQVIVILIKSKTILPILIKTLILFSLIILVMGRLSKNVRKINKNKFWVKSK